MKIAIFINLISENTVKFLLRGLAELTNGTDCNSQHKALMNMVLSYDESYGPERISHIFLICFKKFLHFTKKSGAVKDNQYIRQKQIQDGSRTRGLRGALRLFNTLKRFT